MSASPNVVKAGEAVRYQDAFEFTEPVKSVTWMDNAEEVPFVQVDGRLIVHTSPTCYGRSLVVRVAKIVCG